jgi:GDA1/CD39 (nucleoside phosphatase) family
MMKALRLNHGIACLIVVVALLVAFCGMSMASASEKPVKHPVEDDESWRLHLERRKRRRRTSSNDIVEDEGPNVRHRFLKHKNKDDDTEHNLAYLGSTRYKGGDIYAYEKQEEDEFQQHEQKQQLQKLKDEAQERKKFKQRMSELYADSGINIDTVHGLMIDAGSQGSRMHIYEWEPRILRNEQDVQDAVAGNKLSFPGTDTRWTERLRPGLATFASIKDDDKLQRAVADYLAPLLNFATTVLHTKRASFHEYPIFLRATAGMRILDTQKYGMLLII